MQTWPLTGTAEQKEHAAGALSNLAINDDVCTKIAELGGLPPLVSLCKTGTEKQRP